MQTPKLVKDDRGPQCGQEVLQAPEQIPWQPVEKIMMLPPYWPWMTTSENVFAVQHTENPMPQEVDVS